MDEMSIGGKNVKRNFVSFSQYQILGLPPEHFWTSNSNYMEDQSNYTDSDRNGQTSSSGSSSTADSQVQFLMPKMPITQKPVIYYIFITFPKSSYSISVSAPFNWSFANANLPTKSGQTDHHQGQEAGKFEICKKIWQLQKLSCMWRQKHRMWLLIKIN
jgi:hypothetical protein